jgi:hypothetical protein
MISITDLLDPDRRTPRLARSALTLTVDDLVDLAMVVGDGSE